MYHSRSGLTPTKHGGMANRSIVYVRNCDVHAQLQLPYVGRNYQPTSHILQQQCFHRFHCWCQYCRRRGCYFSGMYKRRGGRGLGVLAGGGGGLQRTPLLLQSLPKGSEENCPNQCQGNLRPKTEENFSPKNRTETSGLDHTLEEEEGGGVGLGGGGDPPPIIVRHSNASLLLLTSGSAS